MAQKNLKEQLKQYLDEELVRNKYCDSYALGLFSCGELVEVLSNHVNRDTYFDVASSGKVLVTSTLVLKTLGKEKIKLTDTLAQYFDHVPEDKKAITVQQLLTHTSGIIRTNLPDNSYELDHDTIAAYILKAPLAFVPGSDYVYSCNGFILLGFILEKIWKKPLSLIFEEMLKEPLGMTRATFTLPLEEQNRVISHRRDRDGDFPGDDENLYRMRECAGSGGQFYTLADVEKLLKAILDKSSLLYPKEIYTLAERDYTPHYSTGRALGYRYVDDRLSPRDSLLSTGSIGHWGSTGTWFFIDRKQDLFIVLFTNMRRFCTKKYGMNYQQYSEFFAKMRSRVMENIKKMMM